MCKKYYIASGCFRNKIVILSFHLDFVSYKRLSIYLFLNIVSKPNIY